MSVANVCAIRTNRMHYFTLSLFNKNLYMFRADLLLLIKRYYSVYTAVAICHAFMLAGANINA